MMIGVIGCGSIGRRHLRLLRELDGLDVVASDPAVPDTVGVDELLDQRPDGVVIASPDRFHVPQTLAALKCGAAVLVEKPLCDSSDDARALLQCDHSRVLVGYTLRYNAVLRLTQEIIASGDLGHVVSFHLTVGAYETLVLAQTRFSPTDRDRLYFDYSHEWDYLRSLLGSVTEGVAVAHQSGNRELSQNPNVVDALLKLQSGATGTVHLDYVRSGGGRRFTLLGDRGALDADFAAGTVLLSGYKEAAKRLYDVGEERDAMYRRQIGHFLKVVERKASPLVSVHDGVEAVCIAEALVRSSRTKLWESVAVLDATGVPPGAG